MEPLLAIVISQLISQGIIPMLVTMSTPPVNFLTLLLEKFRKEPKPINDDLHKAIKIAYLKALVEIAENITKGQIQSFRLHQPGKLQAKIKEWRAEIEILPKLEDIAEIKLPVQNTEEIEQLLLSHGQLSDENIRELERRLVNEALADMVDLPAEYQEQVNTSLFQRFYDHFVEQLKSNRKAFDAFELDYLPKINQSLNEVKAGQVEIVLTMKNLFGQIIQSLEDLHRDIAEILSRLDPQNPQLTDKKWQVVASLMLAEQRALSSNLFTSADGVELNIIDVYTHLGLEERKQQQKVKGDFLPGQFTQNIQEQVTITPISENQFQDVLREGQSPTSQGKRLAIIGEAGAGKTTRLQMIADFILEEKLGLPIWVPLRQLTGSFGLSDFLENWLKNATGQKNLLADFQRQFQAGKVWLLLDGLDEMTDRITADHGNLLQGWWSQARFVVTCRVNVWDNYRGAFDQFDVYRNLEFQEDEVKSFIEKFFGKLKQVEAGEKLWSVLQGENHSRLQDLIGNPLRLFLLCWTWYQGEQNLPETQAGLYEKLVEQLYRWKPNGVSINKEERRLIQKKLSQLALMGINGQDCKGKTIPRFWFSESLVDKVFEDDSILQLALRVGLINQIGKVAEQDERAYRFYHRTFQEYFAALGVPHWKYFLPCNHVNFPLKDQQYRIFSSEWEQVILLWFGRSDIDEDKVKEEFINKLVTFDDECYHFYKYQAYFLAGVGINEFKTCSLAEKIIKQVVKWGFGDFNEEKQEWQTCLYSIEEGARKVLLRTLREKVISNLLDLLKCTNINIHKEVRNILEKIDPGNEGVVQAPINLLQDTDNKHISWFVTKNVGKIDPENESIVETPIAFLQNLNNENFRQLINILVEIEAGNDSAIPALISILQNPVNNYIRWHFANDFKRVAVGKEPVIQAYIALLQDTDNNYIRYYLANILNQTITSKEHRKILVTAIQPYLNNEAYENNSNLFEKYYHILWNIAHNLSYPEFYQAWHNNPSPLNLAQLSQVLQEQIVKDNLTETYQIHLIDGSKFIDQDNPSLDIYKQLLNQECQHDPDGRPKTLAELNFYWDQIRRNSDKKTILIFYENPIPLTPQGFSHKFINTLSRFEGAIALIDDNIQSDNIKTFISQDPNLLQNIIDWVKTIS